VDQFSGIVIRAEAPGRLSGDSWRRSTERLLRGPNPQARYLAGAMELRVRGFLVLLGLLLMIGGGAVAGAQ